MFFLPKVAQAAGGAENVVYTVVPKIVDNIVMPLVMFVFALAIVYFVWGVASFMINSNDPEKRAQGQKHILWATIGLAIMVSVFGIIRFVANTVGQGSSIGF